VKLLAGTFDPKKRVISFVPAVMLAMDESAVFCWAMREMAEEVFPIVIREMLGGRLVLKPCLFMVIEAEP